MNPAPDPFCFFQVSSQFANAAFAFHESIASSNAHIWPRTEAEIKKYADDGELFGVRDANGGFVGLCYVTLADNEWELGGLTVSTQFQNLQLGSTLVRFALAHTIANQNPWAVAQKVIAYVHEENNEPRGLLNRLGFERVGRVEKPAHEAPASMKRNEAGNLVGHKFEYPPKAVGELCEWFEREPSEKAKVTFDAGPRGMAALKETLRAVAKEQGTTC